MQTWVEISRSALFHNISLFRALVGERLFASIIKSNAYGHGIETVARLSLEFGADVLGVNSIDEALLLRQSFPTAKILIMGEIVGIEKFQRELADSNFWIVASRVSSLKFLSQLVPRPKIHIKVDTGMGRLGHSGEEMYSVLNQIHSETLPIDGIMMHFASTEDFTEHSYSMKQLDKFLLYINYAEKLGYQNLIRHSASSASTMLFEDARLDMVRIGISLYGFWPSEETKFSLTQMGKKELLLKPVLSWKTRIAHIREVQKGDFIGYGSTHKMTHSGRIAVIPVGYHEGWDRRLSNHGYVLIRGDRASIVGRVCMNMTMVDITHIDEAVVGDVVTLIGKDGDEFISADSIAEKIGTINYDVVTRIHPKFNRIVVE